MALTAKQEIKNETLAARIYWKDKIVFETSIFHKLITLFVLPFMLVYGINAPRLFWRSCFSEDFTWDELKS
jgi:hypothetical protein